MRRTARILRRSLVICGIVAAGAGLYGCGAANPIEGPGSARDVSGTAVDPKTGIPLPGAPEGNRGL